MITNKQAEIAKREEELAREEERVRAERAKADASVRNYQRIMRERTNRERGLSQCAPGYVVIKTGTAFDGEDHKLVGMRTIIQTPWPDEMNPDGDDGVISLCRRDHFGGLIDEMYAYDCGNAPISERWQHAQEAAAKGKICAVEIRFGTDPRTHLWCAKVFHSVFLPPGLGGRKPKGKQQPNVRKEINNDQIHEK